MNKIYLTLGIGIFIVLPLLTWYVLERQSKIAVPILPNDQTTPKEIQSQTQIQDQQTAVPEQSSSQPATGEDPNQPPLLLKSIGLNLDTYDPATKKAGDFLFTNKKLQFDRLWMGYGFTIPADQSAGGTDKHNPQPTFIVPLGTPVRSLVDGVVTDIVALYSGDWSVMVSSDQNSQWIYETEHVVNPKVKVGDRVIAGQIVAEAANFNNSAPEGFGAFEIGILRGGNPPQHVCPFAYLDPSVKENITKKIVDLYTSWEAYKGDTSLYNETLETPGCLTLDPIEG